MNWMAAIIAGTVFAGITAGGFFASYQGWGIPGKLDQPASVRQESLSGKRRGPIGYFSSRRHRRHHRGGFHGGK